MFSARRRDRPSEMTWKEGYTGQIIVGTTARQILDAPSPSTVESTVTDVLAVGLTNQRKAFHSTGRFWVFFRHGIYLVYRSSTDGKTWSDETIISELAAARHFCIFYDGTYLHYARYDIPNTYYRRGIPKADGTISWSAAEQSVHNGTTGSDEYHAPSICVDSGGYAWITATHYNGVNTTAWVFKNKYNDGTWVTDNGFPYQLDPKTAAIDFDTMPVPLTAGKVFCAWGVPQAAGGGLYGRPYVSGFGSIETISTETDENLYSIVAHGDEVHVVYLKRGYPWGIWYRRRYDTSWTAEETVIPDVNNKPVLGKTPEGNLYCFTVDRPTTNHVGYKRRRAGVWDATVTDWIDESATVLRVEAFSCFYELNGGYMGFLYMTGAASPYTVRFNHLIVVLPSIPSESLIVKADDDNTDNIFWGFTSELTTSTGFRLAKAQMMIVPIDDLSKLWFIAGAAAQKLYYARLL